MNRNELELWTLNVKCGSYSQYLSVWNKVTLGYAIDIWKDSIDNFPSYDWIMYNNKRLKLVDLREDIMQYRNYSTIYLRVSLAGSGITDYVDMEYVEIMIKGEQDYYRNSADFECSFLKKSYKALRWKNPYESKRKTYMKMSYFLVKRMDFIVCGKPAVVIEMGSYTKSFELVTNEA
jgi:hypothetical protein